MRILIAEDDHTSRKLLSAVLEKQGHTEALFSHGLCPERAEKLYPDEMGND